MQKKALFFIICFWATIAAHGTNLTLTTVLESENPGLSFRDCNVPAPTNFHVVEMGVTTAKLAWNYQPDATGGYRIRTYRSSDHQLINTTLRAQDELDVTIKNLTAGTGYYFKINSRCENGEDSELNVIIEGYTLIIELVVDGYEGPSNTLTRCTINDLEDFCEFDVEQTYHFKVQKGIYERKFGILATLGPNGITSIALRLKEYNNSNMPIKFYCDQEYNSPNPTCNPLYEVCIYYNSILLAKIGVTIGNGAVASKLFCTEYVSGAIYRVDPNGNGFADPGNGTHGTNPSPFSNDESLLVSASPNPFTESLDVQISKYDAEKISIHLYNLSGQKVLDQQFSGGQNQYTLSTQNLANGFYLLRIEADGNVQTLKVVKSE